MNNRISFNSRDEEVRVTINKEEAIRRIEQVYQSKYDPSTVDFDVWDQLLACEAVDESTPVSDTYYNKFNEPSESASVNGNDNDSYKRKDNFQLTLNKLQITAKLKTCTYKTPPKEIAQLLEELFREYDSKPLHWVYVAQQWTPRAVNRVINKIIKLHTSGQKTIQNPAAYFTFLIKKRKRRKGL